MVAGVWVCFANFSYCAVLRNLRDLCDNIADHRNRTHLAKFGHQN